MVDFALVSASTRSDALAAADALAAEGVSKVLLFGSLARGSAGLHSDIDLVAIFDDLDYSERFAWAGVLTSVAVRAANCEVDVFITDRPEWLWRTTRVSASMEAAIAPDAVALLDAGPGAVQWGKEIGLARTNQEEARDRLTNALHALLGMYAPLAPATAATWLGRGPTVEMVRIWNFCSNAAQAIENTVKAFRAAANPTGPVGHDIAALLSQTGQHRIALDEALAPVRTNTIKDPRVWLPSPRPPFNDVGLMRIARRIAGSYGREIPDATRDRREGLAPRIGATAAAAATLAGSHLAVYLPKQAGQDLTLSEVAAHLGGYLAANSVVTGLPHKRVGLDV